MIYCCICTEAEGRRYDDDAHSSRSGIIKLGAIRDIIDRVSGTHVVYFWFSLRDVRCLRNVLCHSVIGYNQGICSGLWYI